MSDWPWWQQVGLIVGIALGIFWIFVGISIIHIDQTLSKWYDKVSGKQAEE